ncbi:unnamed protein product [Diabrotica balteata]|uniref:Uncharacterized protein n=1 Tax=Diabrotica balteata TaxID=107213 RepID=A0A9N9X4V0_DIABA|nr:unnamed protein product [Diabrotica balteata]
MERGHTINYISQVAEKRDPKDYLAIADWLEYLPERVFQVIEEDLNFWFERTEEREQILRDEEICKSVQ